MEMHVLASLIPCIRRSTWIVSSFALLILATSSSVICQNVSNGSFSLPSPQSQLVTVSDASVPALGVAILNQVGQANHSQTSGRALFANPLQLRNSSSRTVASFNTSFTFSIETANNNAGAHGMAFIIVPDSTQVGDPDKYLGILTPISNNRPQNHVFAVEIDNWMDKEFNDPSYSHIGVNINSMNSSQTLNLCSSDSAGCRYFINSGNFTLSISYDGANKTLFVSLESNEAGNEAMEPIKGLDLYDVFEDFMYVGFSGSTGGYFEKHTIYSWTFTSTLSVRSSPALTPTPSGAQIKHKSNGILAIAIGVPVAVAALLLGGLILRLRRRKELLSAEYDSEEDPELSIFYKQFQIGARRFSYRELRAATRDFSAEEELGRGAFGIVYRGTLSDSGTMIAVKHVKEGSRQGEREFLAELSIISRVRHRNLLHLRGWCHTKDHKLLLVYDYMPKGSLEKLLRAEDEGKEPALPWENRFKIMKGVAAALAYLHEEWEECIIHRDVKSSNVLLDANSNAHLGDFGLARLMDHDQTGKTTMAAGTFGYIAPELAHSAKATTKTDVYSFGILALEVGSGRRPLDWKQTEESQMVLLETVWDAHEEHDLLRMADPKLKGKFNRDEMLILLRLGLLCSLPDPSARPTMRQAGQILSGDAALPPLPASQPEMLYSWEKGRNTDKHQTHKGL